MILAVMPSYGKNELEQGSTPAPVSTETPFQKALQTSKIASPDVLAFYGKMQNEPVWFFQGHLTKCGQTAVEVLHNADEEGLNPLDYQDVIQISASPENWIHAEILLTKRFLEFIDHLRVGRIDPMKISHDIKFHSPKTKPVDLLVEAIQNKGSACLKLHHLAPDIPAYAHLKKILAGYRDLAEKSNPWPKLTSPKAFKRGDTDPEIKTLRKILFLQGDLKDDNDPESEEFDATVDKALRQFQKRHTLEADGVTGGKTKEALNRPIAEMIQKVIVNMERLRWLPDDFGDKYLMVNVAGYQVQAFEKSDLKLTIPAIVGRPSRRTPLFYASLKNVIINPSWGVPYNILVHDKLPKIINDPDYVRRSGFTVTDEMGNAVDPDEADWENEGRNYRLRQSPGRHNALGRVKFNIENPYTIYLHGTPEEKLFTKTARAFSSGCVRLKSPVELAEWVLNNESKWSSEDIEAAINKGATQTVKPQEDLPVFFTYQTVWMGNDGLTHVSDDPYKMDAKMVKVLNVKM